MSKEFKDSKFLSDLKKGFGDLVSIGFDDKFNIKDKDWYSTGSLMLNLQLNGGKIFIGGCPAGKITVFAGGESSGKTFIAINTIKDFFIANPYDGYAIYFDSESNVSPNTFLNAGIPEDKINNIIIKRVTTLEEFRTNIIQTYKKSIENNVKLFVVLDSLGGLITQKELTEAEAEPNKDGIVEVKATVGRPQQTIKQIMKILEHYSGRVNSPVIIISHVYADIGSLFGGTTIAGGSGVRYFNSNCVEFSRAQNKEADNTIHTVNGIIVTSKLVKSRFARELTKVKSLINFNTGIDYYYGLVSLLEASHLIEKSGNRYLIEKDSEGKFVGKKYWSKELTSNIDLLLPFLPELEKWTIRNFGLGKLSLSTKTDDINLSEENKITDFEEFINEENVAKEEDSE